MPSKEKMKMAITVEQVTERLKAAVAEYVVYERRDDIEDNVIWHTWKVSDRPIKAYGPLDGVFITAPDDKMDGLDKLEDYAEEMKAKIAEVREDLAKLAAMPRGEEAANAV